MCACVCVSIVQQGELQSNTFISTLEVLHCTSLHVFDQSELSSVYLGWLLALALYILCFVYVKWCLIYPVIVDVLGFTMMLC